MKIEFELSDESSWPIMVYEWYAEWALDQRKRQANYNFKMFLAYVFKTALSHWKDKELPKGGVE